MKVKEFLKKLGIDNTTIESIVEDKIEDFAPLIFHGAQPSKQNQTERIIT